MKENEQHAEDANKKAANPPCLHRANHMNAPLEIIDLPLQHFIGIRLVSAVQLANQCGKGEESVCVRQQQ